MEKAFWLIRLHGDKIYYSPDRYVTIAQTNLPVGAIKFSYGPDRFWKVETLRYDSHARIHQIRITDYEPGVTDPFYEQSSKSEINRIEFAEKLDWDLLEQYLSAYIKSHLEPFISTKLPMDQPNEKTAEEEPISDQMFFEEEEPPNEYLIQENFWYPFSELAFNYGFVTIRRKFKEYPKEIEINIDNPNIRSEFNYISSYFPRIFNGQTTFLVSVRIEVCGKVITSIEATAPDISAINDQVIESIKHHRAAKIRDIPLEPDSKMKLFSADEIQAKLDENGEGSQLLHLSGEELVNTISNLSDVRNKAQLQYLAGIHNPKEKIRFTLTPHFGFMFLIDHGGKNHFCWELLNSHATYLWSFNREEALDLQNNAVEECITLIWEIGRQKFKQAIRKKAVQGTYEFKTIKHPSSVDGGFDAWKSKLSMLLLNVD